MRFIDDLCAINDSFEFNDSFKDVYPPELEFKVEQLENHAAFLDIDLKIVNDKIIYMLFDKRINFPFLLLECHIFSVTSLLLTSMALLYLLYLLYQSLYALQDVHIN